MCDITRQMLPIAEMMEGLSFPIQEKIVISFVPFSDRTEEGAKLLRTWLEYHDREEKVPLGFEPPPAGTLLADLEQRFKWTECYGWLAMRFPMTFSNFDQCKFVKDHIVAVMRAELSHSDEDWKKVHESAQRGPQEDLAAKPVQVCSAFCSTLSSTQPHKQDRRLVDVEAETNTQLSP